jgi:hypothetical protein
MHPSYITKYAHTYDCKIFRMQRTDVFSSFIMHVLLSMENTSYDHKSYFSFFSHHSYTNDFALIKTHYKDGCILSLNTTQGGTRYFSNKYIESK